MFTGQHIFKKSRQPKSRLAVGLSFSLLTASQFSLLQIALLPAGLLNFGLLNLGILSLSCTQPAVAKSHSDSSKEEHSGYTQSKEARLLADQVLKAIGGYAAFKRFNDIPCRAKGKIVQTSSLSNGVNTFDCDILLKREKQKITISFLGQPLTTVYDGVMCWTQQGDTILPSDQVTAKRIAEDITHGLLLLEKIALTTTRMEIGAPTTVDGKPCDTLLVWAEDGEPTTFSVAKDNHYVVGSSYPGVDLEQGVKVEKRYVYSDFRLVENTQQPFKVVEYSGDKIVSETIVNEVAIDPSVTDAIFVMPKERPSARLAAGAIIVPFEYTSSEIVVTTKVNGLHDLRFIVDTGATQCLLDKSVATKIGATSLGSDSGVSMTTGSGTIKTGAVMVKSLALGELEIANVPFAVADLNSFGNIQGVKPAGLIGANVLKRYLMTVDYENEKLKFADPTQVVVPEGAIVINTKPSLGMSGLAVEGNIDGKQKVTFLIDTGAAFNNISETKVKSLLWGPVLKVGILKGLDGKPVETGAARFEFLDLDKHHIEKPVFSIAPQLLEGQGEAGIISSKDLAIIGNPLLSRYTVTFDYRNQRLFFEQSALVKKKNELARKIDDIRNEWIRTRNANQAIRDLTSVSDSAHHEDLPGIEALARAELAVMLCQKNGGNFTPEHIFAPLTSSSLTSDATASAGVGDGKKLSPQTLFAEADGQLLMAYNLSEKCKDKSILGRVLATWGYIYASQCQNISYLSSAKQKIGKAVVLCPTDADVLAASGYFLSRLEAIKTPKNSDKEKVTSASNTSNTSTTALKSASAKLATPAKLPTANKSTDKEKDLPAYQQKLTTAMKSANELGKWLAEQIIDQAVMIDPANYLALQTKLDRARSQGKTDEAKTIIGQLKHYYPSINAGSGQK
ncbi:hypothetical protein BH11CYA1_BH11CYA1_36570 [soil metagenome]